MADDYVRETLRTLRERTGDAYVPLSEVLAAIQRRVDECMVEAERSYEPLAEVSFRCEADRMRETLREIERRWGPGPRCEQAELDSPNFAPQELRDFRDRGYERRNRRG